MASSVTLGRPNLVLNLRIPARESAQLILSSKKRRFFFPLLLRFPSRSNRKLSAGIERLRLGGFGHLVNNCLRHVLPDLSPSRGFAFLGPFCVLGCGWRRFVGLAH